MGERHWVRRWYSRATQATSREGADPPNAQHIEHPFAGIAALYQPADRGWRLVPVGFRRPPADPAAGRASGGPPCPPADRGRRLVTVGFRRSPAAAATRLALGNLGRPSAKLMQHPLPVSVQDPPSTSLRRPPCDPQQSPRTDPAQQSSAAEASPKSARDEPPGLVPARRPEALNDAEPGMAAAERSTISMQRDSDRGTGSPRPGVDRLWGS